MLELSVSGRVGAPFRHRFDKTRVVIGRSAKSDLVIDDASISRFHAELRLAARGWVVLDRGSHNGTRLDDRPVEQEEPLKSGDCIHIGHVQITFEVVSARSGAAETNTASLHAMARPQGLFPAGELVGQAPSLKKALAALDRVAATTANVLITGENGTGKELAAVRLHRRSPRAAAPLVVVNCPALHGSLLEPELFGVERGVATGVEPRMGKLEAAEGGTLFLDEIGDMDLPAQAKILRFLQERTVERVGGRNPRLLDVRIVAATHHDLEQDVKRGTFRRDLLHRLKTVQIVLPPLRERPEDIPLLIEHFLATAEGPRVTMSDEARAVLMRHSFPGNVRELEQLVEGARLLAETSIIGVQDLPEEVVRGEPGAEATDPGEPGAPALYQRVVVGHESFWEAVHRPFLRRQVSAEQVRELIRRAHSETGGSYKRVAELLGVGGEYKRLMNFLDYHDLGVG